MNEDLILYPTQGYYWDIQRVEIWARDHDMNIIFQEVNYLPTQAKYMMFETEEDKLLYQMSHR